MPDPLLGERLMNVNEKPYLKTHSLSENNRNNVRCVVIQVLASGFGSSGGDRRALYLCNNNEPFLNRIVRCEEKWIYTTTSDDQLSDWTKKLQTTFQSQTCTKKRSWPLVVCCLSDPLQLSESCQNHYIWKVWSTDRWDAPKTAMSAAVIDQELAQFFCMTIPDLRSHNQHFKG